MNTINNVIDVFWRFLVLGCTSFGGPVAHLGYFRQSLIEKRQWLSDRQYAELVSLCQFLPGPASSQVGFALGYSQAGFAGAFAAFIAFTAPSVCLLLGFAYIIEFVSIEVQTMLIHGLKLAACIIVADAVWGMWAKLCSTLLLKSLAVVSAVVLIAFPIIGLQLIVLLVAAVIGGYFFTASSADRTNALALNTALQVNKHIARACLILFFVLLLMAVFVAPYGENSAQIAGGFYQAGALVFGGGHVVLPLLEDLTVNNAWLSEQTFLAGYGASQSLPGPLFSFAAYLGANISSSLPPTAVVLLATVAIFLPGFLLMVGVLPYWYKMQRFTLIANAVAGINAAVVGVLAAAFINPLLLASIGHIADLIFVALAFVLLKRFSLSPLIVVVLSLFFAFGAKALYPN
ncbi:chromate efflux transporter [Agaribacter marinus]|nr:chromate efflux transporter [Agaribacter marinus]